LLPKEKPRSIVKINMVDTNRNKNRSSLIYDWLSPNRDENTDDPNDFFSWSNVFREWRHNPCIMKPITAFFLLFFAIFWIVLVLVKFPTLLLGLLLTPILNRMQWIIEFWYPTSLGRCIHLTMVRWAMRSHTHNTSKSSSSSHHIPPEANPGCHSRTLETRIEIIPQRIYIHPIPQFLDNLGYLIVSLPTTNTISLPYSEDTIPVTASTETAKLRNTASSVRVSVEQQPSYSPREIVAMVVDCGDADAVQQNIQRISEHFYNQMPIRVQAILSTHKHHDHTAGNIPYQKMHPSVQAIMGGAVERVPGCNVFLKNGDVLPLHPDMNELITIEAIATPAHTRGSISYVLRQKQSTSPLVGIVFTGDTVFSAGGGVPFEADIDAHQEEQAPRMTANAYINASASMNAVERNFAEILFRSFIPTARMSADQILVLPGHEYTHELLSRQFTNTSSSAGMSESCRWKNFTPATFFETVTQLYVALHRRTLPHTSGKLMTVPTSIRRELNINPQFRSIKQRGILLIHAIKQWNRNLAQKSISEHDNVGPAFDTPSVDDHRYRTTPTNTASSTPTKTRAAEREWNLDSNDINRSVFTTVYSSDLDSLLEDLRYGTIDTAMAAHRLQEMKSALDKPLIGRRPIPGTLPSSRMVYRGLLAFALLGSSPTAMTRSDAARMNLPSPVSSKSSDRIRVQKKRLVAVLYWLGLLNDDDGKAIVAMIDQLWKETIEYCARVNEAARCENMKLREEGEKVVKDSTDEESATESEDVVNLGALKWVMYGIPEQRPQSFLSRLLFCLPCKAKDDDRPSEEHPAGKSGMDRHNGELVRHDVLQCPLCRNATGCPAPTETREEVDVNPAHSVHIAFPLPVSAPEDESSEDESSSAFVEVSPQNIAGTVLKEYK
jgi:hydroxyacylglutathione hydrolase